MSTNVKSIIVKKQKTIEKKPLHYFYNRPSKIAIHEKD
jgi:hypothetical protein